MATDELQLNGMSDEAVARATGQDWNAWLRFLDDLGAQELDHKGIVALLAGPGAYPTAGGSSRWPLATSRPGG